MHVIAAKAVAFLEALQPEFKGYQQQVVANARAMAATLMARGYKIVSGGTDNHLFLVDLIERSYTGKDADAALGRAHITVNKNTVPNDPRSPFVTSGLRIGTPAVTTRGFKEPEVTALAGWIADVLDDVTSQPVIEGTRQSVLEICRRFRSTAEAAPTQGLRRCIVPSARTRRPRSSIRASRPRASRCGAVVSACSAQSASRPSSPRSSSCRASSRATRRASLRRGEAALGMLRALEKRPVSSEAVDAAINHVCHKLRTLGEREVPARLVGELVMDELHKLDEVAYVRFASVYRSFQDVDAFSRGDRAVAFPTAADGGRPAARAVVAA